LYSVAKRVRVLELPDLDSKPVKDAADYFNAGGKAEDLIALVDAAPDWTPSVPEVRSPEITAPKGDLPGIDNAEALLRDTNVPLPPEIIEGLLHQGLKGVLGSSSKA